MTSLREAFGDDDPIGKSIEKFREIRDEIEKKVLTLIKEIE